MTSSLAAYTDGIVNTKGGSAPFELPELQALMGILTALPPSPLPTANAMYQRLQTTLTSPTTSTLADTQAAAVRVCLCLAVEPSNREAVLGVVEAAQTLLDAAMVSARAQLPLASEASRLPSDVLLLMTLCTNCELECRQALELFDQKVEILVPVVAASVATAAGVLPGIAAPFRGAVQTHVLANLVSLLRELTSWKLYDHLTFRRYENGAGAADAGPGNDVEMHKLAGPFKGYIGNLCMHVTQTTLFTSLGQYYQASLSRQGASEQADLAWEVLLLVENLLTFTNVFAVQFRKHLLASGLLAVFLAPYLSRLLQSLAVPVPITGAGADGASTCTSDVVAMVTLTARVLATMTFSVGGYQVYWRGDQMLPSALGAAVQALLSPSALGTARALLLSGHERVALLTQLVRLAVNGHITLAAAPLRQLWSRALVDPKEQAALAYQLSDPTRRRQPLDVRSPVYESLRDVFVLGGSHGRGVVAAAGGDGDDSGSDAEDELELRGASRRQLRGRGGRGGRGGRLFGRGGRNHGGRRRGGAGKGKHRQRENRRLRRRQRYAFLRGIRDRPDGATGSGVEPAAVEEQRLTQLSSDEDESEEEAVPVVGTATRGVDLSRWRKGPPPAGVPTRYICALSHRMIRSEPALSPQGYVFDRDVILDYLQTYSVCPVSGEPLYAKDLIIDMDLLDELSRVRFNFINVL